MQLWTEGHHGWQESHTETAVIETKEIASLLKANNPQDRRGAMQCLRMMLDLYISVYMPYIDSTRRTCPMQESSEGRGRWKNG